MSVETSHWEQEDLLQSNMLSPEQQELKEQEKLLKEQEKADTEKAKELLNSIENQKDALTQKVIERIRIWLDSTKEYVSNSIDKKEQEELTRYETWELLAKLWNSIPNVDTHDISNNTLPLTKQEQDTAKDILWNGGQLSPDVHLRVAVAGKQKGEDDILHLTKELPEWLSSLSA